MVGFGWEGASFKLLCLGIDLNIKIHGVEVRQLLLCVSPVVAALLFPEPLTWRLRLAASQL